MDRNPKDPHSSTERHEDPIGHSQGHRLDPTDSIGKQLRESERDAGSDIEREGAKKSPTDTSDRVKNEEEAGGGWKDNVQPQDAPQHQGLQDRAKQLFSKGTLKGLKKKGPLSAIIITVIIGLFIGGGFFATLLGPFAFIANVHLDLNDILSINISRTDAQLANKIVKFKSASDRLGAGCGGLGSKLPIKCRYKAVSPWLEDKLKGAGIEVKGKKVLGYTLPESYSYRGDGGRLISYGPDEFKQAIMGGDLELRNRVQGAVNKNWLSYKGKPFIKTVLAKWGVSEKPMQLTGDHDEKARQLMGAESGGSVDDPKLKPKTETDADGNEVEVEGVWVDEDGNEYDANKKAIIDETATNVKESSKSVTRMSAGALERMNHLVGVAGLADAACGVKNMIGTASIAAKIANSDQLVKFAWRILPLAGMLQAGHITNITPEMAEIVQEWFTDTDSREFIIGLLHPDQSDELGEIPNPDFGKNAMDSEVYRMSSGAGIAAASIAESTYSLGYGPKSTLQSVLRWILDKGDFVANIFGFDSCEKVAKWYVRGGSILVGLGLMGLQAATCPATVGATCVSLSGQIVAGVKTAVLYSVGAYVANNLLNKALSQTLIDDSMQYAPVERGAATWTGMAAMYSEHARIRGMMPGNADEIVAYQQDQNVARQQFIAQERRESDPFDINNPYSLTGSIALSLSDHIPHSLSASSLASIPTGISSFVASGLTSFFKPYSAYAASLDTARFEQCDDEEYKSIDIDADVQCNVRFVMPKESTKWDPIEAAEEMEARGFVEKDTTTGYPKGYSPPEPSKTQSGAMNILKATAKEQVVGFINSIYNTDDYGKYNDEDSNPNGAKYALFLDYCVYRAMPFGETYEESGAIGAPDKEWIDGSRCRDTTDDDINLFRIYVFDMSVSDDLDGPVQDPYCAPSGLGAGSSIGRASAAVIDAAIEASEKANKTTSKLHGKGQAIIDLSNQHGVNSDYIAVTLLAETQFGADGSGGPDHNNFGWNKKSDLTECEPFLIAGDLYNCYNTPEAGVEAIILNISTDIYKGVGPTAPPGTQPGTVASVRTIYCPEGDGIGDGVCNLQKFLNMGESINIPIKADDRVFATGAGTSASSLSSASSLLSSAATTSSNAATISKEALEGQITSYGLPAPQASGEKGYEALAKSLKENDDALWAAQSLLAGEKNAKSKGFEIKDYLNTAWIWFEGDKSWGPEPYEMNCLNDTEGTEAAYVCPSSASGGLQVAGYQPTDVRDKFTEVYNKFYSEDELTSILEKVIENSSKASKDIWDYNDPSNASNMALVGDISSVTMQDIWPNKAFGDVKAHIINIMLGKDPNMVAALNSYAIIGDDPTDVLPLLQASGADECGGGWASYICGDGKQELSNMMMALYLIDDGTTPTSGVQCAAAALGRGAGEGIEAVWGGVGEKDLTYGFDYGPAAGPWYSYATEYGMSGFTHTGTDIPMDPYAPVYTPVDGVVVCEKNGVGEGIHTGAAGCGGAGDYSGQYAFDTDACLIGYDPSKPSGAGTVMIRIYVNGQQTDDYIRLGHLAGSLVKLGDTVTANQQIGLAGCMNGWHTHVEYFIPAEGETPSGYRLVDPVEYLGKKGGS